MDNYWCILLQRPVSITGDIGCIDDYARIYAVKKERGLRKILTFLGKQSDYEIEFRKRFLSLCRLNLAESYYYKDIDFIITKSPDSLTKKLLCAFPFLSMQAISKEGDKRMYVGSDAKRRDYSPYIPPNDILFKETAPDNS